MRKTELQGRYPFRGLIAALNIVGGLHSYMLSVKSGLRLNPFLPRLNW